MNDHNVNPKSDSNDEYSETYTAACMEVAGAESCNIGVGPTKVQTSSETDN